MLFHDFLWGINSEKVFQTGSGSIRGNLWFTINCDVKNVNCIQLWVWKKKAIDAQTPDVQKMSKMFLFPVFGALMS